MCSANGRRVELQCTFKSCFCFACSFFTVVSYVAQLFVDARDGVFVGRDVEVADCVEDELRRVVS